MGWYAVSSKPRQEELAEQSLQRLGVETFYPQLKEDRVIRRKRQTAIAPLFPGYLFARFDLERQFRAVNFAPGVRKLVAFGAQLAVVDEAVIDAIKWRLEDGYVVLRPAPFVHGQKVRIRDGVFQGLEAVFEREMTGTDRVVVLLRALAHQARVVVQRDLVVAA